MPAPLLTALPTPIEPAPRLAAAIGMEPDALLVKRDDLLGLGGGGNKVRKLERTCADAIAAGATTLVTTGAAQSNHARLTAAAGARLGLDVELVLGGEAPADGAVSGNLALDALFGARLHWCGDVSAAELDERAATRVQELGSRGVVAARIPYGGSNASGAAAYRDAGDEIAREVPDVRHVVVAVGSAGTAAGLVASLGAARVLGVDTGATPDPVARWAALTSALLVDGGLDEPLCALRLRADQVGEGYSALAPGAQDALLLAARTEGIVLDPIYTGRALAGLVAAVADGDVRPDERTVLVHTGGLPGLFGSAPTLRWAAGLLD